MEQPSWDADAATWRRFAGHLRQRVGAARERAREAEARAMHAEEATARAWKVGGNHRRALAEVEKLLAAAQFEAASVLLTKRRAQIEAARDRRREASL